MHKHTNSKANVVSTQQEMSQTKQLKRETTLQKPTQTSLLANRLKPQDPILPHKGTKYIRLFHIP